MNEIGFALAGIKTEQFAVFEEIFVGNKKVELTTNFNFKMNDDEKRIGVYATFQFEQGKKAFIKLVVSCHFDIHEDALQEFTKNKEITLPLLFMRHLCVITIGTARGILHCKTEGSMLNVFILPTIDVTQLLKEDVVFNVIE